MLRMFVSAIMRRYSLLLACLTFACDGKRLLPVSSPASAFQALGAAGPVAKPRGVAAKMDDLATLTALIDSRAWSSPSTPATTQEVIKAPRSLKHSPVIPRDEVKLGQEFHGRVTQIMPYGVFVDIKVEGFEKGKSKDALLHNKEMMDPTKTFKPGDLAVAFVKMIDERGITLTELRPGSEEFKSGQEVSGTVTVVTDFGAFVDIGAPRDALLHFRDFGTVLEGKTAERGCEAGDKVKAWIRSITSDKKIKLGLVPPSMERRSRRQTHERQSKNGRAAKPPKLSADWGVPTLDDLREQGIKVGNEFTGEIRYLMRDNALVDFGESRMGVLPVTDMMEQSMRNLNVHRGLHGWKWTHADGNPPWVDLDARRCSNVGDNVTGWIQTLKPVKPNGPGKKEAQILLVTKESRVPTADPTKMKGISLQEWLQGKIIALEDGAAFVEFKDAFGAGSAVGLLEASRIPEDQEGTLTVDAEVNVRLFDFKFSKGIRLTMLPFDETERRYDKNGNGPYTWSEFEDYYSGTGPADAAIQMWLLARPSEAAQKKA